MQHNHGSDARCSSGRVKRMGRKASLHGLWDQMNWLAHPTHTKCVRERENGREKMKHLWPNLITWMNFAMFPFDHGKLKPVCDEYKFDFRKNSIQNAAKQFDIQLKSLFYPIQHFTWWLMWSNCDRRSTCHCWCRHHQGWHGQHFSIEFNFRDFF